MSDLNDRLAGTAVSVYFNTAVNGVPTSLAGSPAITVYRDTTVGSTLGVTLSVDYAGTTGLNKVAIATTASTSFYAAPYDFSVILTAGTVSGQSIVGTEVGTFSIGIGSTVLTQADIRTAVGLATANLDTQLAGISTKTTNLPSSMPASTDLTAVYNRIGAPVAASISADIANVGSTIMARLGAPAGASVSADVAAVGVIAASVSAKIGAPAVTVSADIAAIPASASAAVLGGTIETGYSLLQSQRLILAAAVGKASGFTTSPISTVAYRDINDTVNRISAIVSSGNRTSVTVITS